MSTDSPTPSTDSADEALFEMLRIDKLSLSHDDDDEGYPNDHLAGYNSSTSRSFFKLTPPMHCHRPNTSHSPLLLESTRHLLTPSHCSYIMNLGYRATNNGIDFGPQYITQAAHSGTKVKLKKPNRHKVCVFSSDIVLRWIQQALDSSGMHEEILNWSKLNGYHTESFSRSYFVNPRLRLLRYDARDQDIFLPHYDATTTSGMRESKITILLYLNSGDGINFRGGNTLYLNALQPTDYTEIIPECGKIVLFTHELYHASQSLELDDKLWTPTFNKLENEDRFVRGGTKFVLRSDVMFPALHCAASQSMLTTQSTKPPLAKPDVVVQDVVCQKLRGDTSELVNVLQQLNLYQSSVKTFLVPGKTTIQAMLEELGVDSEQARRLTVSCVEAVDGYRGKTNP